MLFRSLVFNNFKESINPYYFIRMTLEEKVNGEIKAAMLAKNTQRLEALRGIKA